MMQIDFDELRRRGSKDTRTISSGEIRWLIGEVDLLRKQIRHMDRKANHGCYNFNCELCDKE